MSADFLESLACRLIDGIDESNRTQLLEYARSWISACNPLNGGYFIELRPLPDQLQAELNAYAVSLRGN